MFIGGYIKVCDRCKKTYFVMEHEGYQERYNELKNGGYVAPKGIEFVFEDVCKGTNIGNLCPDCFEEYQKMQKSFMEDFKHERHTE